MSYSYSDDVMIPLDENHYNILLVRNDQHVNSKLIHNTLMMMTYEISKKKLLYASFEQNYMLISSEIN